MLRILLIVIFLAPLTVFGLSNPDSQAVWLLTVGWHLALGTLVFGVGLVGLVVGILIGWIGELRQRSRARKAESQIRTLEGQLVDLHQRLDRAQSLSAPSTDSHLPS